MRSFQIFPKIIRGWCASDGTSAECSRRAGDGHSADFGLAGMGVGAIDHGVTDFSQAPNIYNEVEGIFPDGRYTLVESSKQVETLGGEHGSREIDIWKLRLDGTGKDFVRMTHFNDYEGWKASNPVIATDGRYAAFQIAHTSDEAGVGYGIVLLRLKD